MQKEKGNKKIEMCEKIICSKDKKVQSWTTEDRGSLEYPSVNKSHFLGFATIVAAVDER